MSISHYKISKSSQWLEIEVAVIVTQVAFSISVWSIQIRSSGVSALVDHLQSQVPRMMWLMMLLQLFERTIGKDIVHDDGVHL